MSSATTQLGADVPENSPTLVGTALSVIAGGHDAQQLLEALRGGGAPADLLSEALAEVQAHHDADRLRGWARALQKQLERATA